MGIQEKFDNGKHGGFGPLRKDPFIIDERFEMSENFAVSWFDSIGRMDINNGDHMLHTEPFHQLVHQLACEG